MMGGKFGQDDDQEIVGYNPCSTHSLASAYSKIVEQLAELDDLDHDEWESNVTYCSFLKQIQKDITAIFNSPSRKYPLFKDVQTQADINAIQRRSHYEYLREHYNKIKQLKWNIQFVKNKFKQDKSKHDFLTYLKTCADVTFAIIKDKLGYDEPSTEKVATADQTAATAKVTIDSVEQNSSPKEQKATLNQDSKTEELPSFKRVCAINDRLYEHEDIYSLATLLGGTYFRASQVFEPLQGGHFYRKGEFHGWGGNCTGHSKTYADEVHAYGRHVRMMGFDYQTQINQNIGNLNGYLVNHTFGERHWSNQQWVQLRNWKTLADELVANLVANQVYLLTFLDDINLKDDSNNNFNHTCSIRLLSKAGIEFFDPNFGCFVFPNMDNFKTWFALYLTNWPLASTFNEITLYQYAPQLSNANASIPMLDQNIDKEKTKTKIDLLFSEIYHDHQNLVSVLGKYSNDVSTNSVNLNKSHKLYKSSANLLRSIEKHANYIYLLSEYLDDNEQAAVVKKLKDEQKARYMLLRSQVVKESKPEAKEHEITLEDEYDLANARIIEQIDLEILRLQNDKVSNDTIANIISALKVLKTRIHAITFEKACTIQLAAVIDSWLKERPNGGSQSYQQIIAMHGFINENTQAFIVKLRAQEINPHRLDVLRTSLLTSILYCLRLNNKASIAKDSLSAMIVQSFEEHQRPRQILLNIKNWSKLKNTNLHALLNTLDVDDQNQLIGVKNKIDRLPGYFEKLTKHSHVNSVFFKKPRPNPDSICRICKHSIPPAKVAPGAPVQAPSRLVTV